MLFCEVCQTEVTEDSKDWLACYCIGYPKNNTENHPPFWKRRPTKRAPDAEEAAASQSVSNTESLSTSDSVPQSATARVA